jgi:hypothetical protein
MRDVPALMFAVYERPMLEPSVSTNPSVKKSRPPVVL